MKRFASALLSAVLCLSLCTPALAAEEQASVLTQKEYIETKAALAAAREHIDAVRAIIIGDAPKTEEEFTAKLRQAQVHVEAVRAIPDLTFEGTEQFEEEIRRYAEQMLRENIVPYLKADTDFDLEKSWEKFVDETIPPMEKKDIRYNTNFLGLEMWCVDGENFLKKLAEKKPKAPAADPTEFSDAKDVQYWPAVASLTKLGIVSGKDGGVFDPAGNVTRAEAAKLIAVIMNGGEANIGARSEPTFTDIQGHWAEGYIEYCADMKIVSGDGNGGFDPDGEVSVIQFYKMALTALGYDWVVYRLAGPGWAEQALECARKTNGRNLTEGLPNDGMDGAGADQPASREMVAQILYNALQATTIEMAPDKNTSGGEIVWSHQPSSLTLLQVRFGRDELPAVPPQPTV